MIKRYEIVFTAIKHNVSPSYIIHILSSIIVININSDNIEHIEDMTQQEPESI